LSAWEAALKSEVLGGFISSVPSGYENWIFVSFPEADARFFPVPFPGNTAAPRRAKSTGL